MEDVADPSRLMVCLYPAFLLSDSASNLQNIWIRSRCLPV